MERKQQAIIAIGLLATTAAGVGGYFYLSSQPPAPVVIADIAPPLNEVETFTQYEPEPLKDAIVEAPLPNDAPSVATISALPLNSDAAKILKYSQQLRIQTVRKLALKEQQAADNIDESTGFPILSAPIGALEPTIEPSQDVANTMTIALSEQISVKSIMRVGKRREATLSLGNELIPVKVGSQFSGITVTHLSDDSVTLKEKGKTYRRFLTIPAPVSLKSKEQS
ncbi:hypothetical protein [Photobacterium damselae]|uniref:hypothetical protein n=1 Tax=Photobacterium damselae TaxID=38293 RepID=UPI001EFCE6A4|nr:hypothetical protein [Photobacterium damselae]MCG9706489.1 hypothetical protein [Photobacterium damselae]